jgi:hypothetical protein
MNSLFNELCQPLTAILSVVSRPLSVAQIVQLIEIVQTVKIVETVAVVETVNSFISQ